MGVVSYAAEVMSDTPALYWKMDETSGLPQDSSGNGRHATVKTIASGHYSQTGPFTGFKGIVFTGDPEGATRTTFSSVTDNFTLEMFFQVQVILGDIQFSIGHINAGAPGSGFDIEIRSGRKFRGNAFGVGGASDSSTTCALNTWYHIVVVRDSGTWKYYVNGSVDTANAGTTAPRTTVSSGVCGVHGTTQMQAAYSQFAIYESALSSTRVAAHYTAASTADSTFTPKIIMS